MATKLTVSGVVRDILLANPTIDTNTAIGLAKGKGLKVDAEKIRHSIHNQRNKIKSEVAAGAVKVAPAAARETTPSSKPAAPATPAATSDLEGVLGNVALVNKIVGVCGSVENARQTAEAVEACGGLAAFLKQLQLVEEIRASKEG